MKTWWRVGDGVPATNQKRNWISQHCVPVLLCPTLVRNYPSAGQALQAEGLCRQPEQGPVEVFSVSGSHPLQGCFSSPLKTVHPHTQVSSGGPGPGPSLLTCGPENPPIPTPSAIPPLFEDPWRLLPPRRQGRNPSCFTRSEPRSSRFQQGTPS